MANEFKSTFIRSKMNKDLDARILPPGEYRDAENIAVSRSEGADVGALENILGNKQISDFGVTAVGVECIGMYTDNATSRVFVFLTNYTDSSNNQLDIPAYEDSYCSVCVYDFNSDNFTVLLQGAWLNFSKTQRVFGINLIENLLFWTDNRNQPRKINIDYAFDRPGDSPNPYYQTEEVISVAKYYPFSVPETYEKVEVTCTVRTEFAGATGIDPYGPIGAAQGFVNIVPQATFTSILEIQGNIPSNLNIHAGLKFYVKDARPDGITNQPTNFESFYPYFNCVRNYKVPWAQMGFNAANQKLLYGEGQSNTLRPLLGGNTSGFTPDPDDIIMTVSEIYATDENALFDALNTPINSESDLTQNPGVKSTDYQDNYLKWFVSNLPFVYTSAGTTSAWNGEVDLVFIQPKIKNKVDRFLPPSYRCILHNFFPPPNVGLGDEEDYIPYKGQAGAALNGTGIASNGMVYDGSVALGLSGGPRVSSSYFPRITNYKNSNGINPNPSTFGPPNTYLAADFVAERYPNAALNPDLGNPKGFLTPYQKSVSAGTIWFDVTGMNGWGFGPADVNPTSGVENYNDLKSYAIRYLQPGMKVHHPLVNDGNTYLIDQIFFNNNTDGDVVNSDWPLNTSSTGKYIGITIRAVDDDNQPVTNWSWPNFEPLDGWEFLNNSYLSFSFPNPYYERNFGGDTEYLKQNFIRLAYRFKFDDNEYSLISPFTQSLFEPQDKGYYIVDDERFDFENAGLAYFAQGDTEPNSSELSMSQEGVATLYENNANQIGLLIDAPYVGNTQIPFNEINEKLKIKEIEIILAESDTTTLRVLKTIPTNDVTVSNNTGFIYEYTWNGDKPFKVLPEKETTRVSDTVPIRALAQEVAGNRVIYGNFVNQHSSPLSLNYDVGVSRKFTVNDEFTSYSTESYPNHTLKQNRSYQVGIVLSDKYGRQSDVILAPPTFNTTVINNDIYSGDTFYAPYLTEQQAISLIEGANTNISNWVGNSIKILFNDTIPESLPNIPGYPGIYRAQGEVKNTSISAAGTSYNIRELNTTTTTSGDGSGLIISIQTLGAGDSIDTFVIADNGEGYKPGDTVSVNRADGSAGNATLTITEIYEENKLGFDSYKVVVKQQEQEYYNLYLPQILNGQPLLSLLNVPPKTGLPVGVTSITDPEKIPNIDINEKMTFAAIGNNINKIPEETTDKNQNTTWSTSPVKLFPRVSQYGGLSTQTVPNYNGVTPSDANDSQKDSEVYIFTGNVFTGDLFQKTISLGLFNDIYSTSTTTTQSYEVYGVDSSLPVLLYKQQDNPFTAVVTNVDNANPFSHPFEAQDSNALVPSNSWDQFYNSYDVDIFGFTPPQGIGSSFKSTSATAGTSGGRFIVGVGVIETEATTSNLDIYFETSTVGKIKDLNYLIQTNQDENVPFSLSITNGKFVESMLSLYWGQWEDVRFGLGVCPINPTFYNVGGITETDFVFSFVTQNALGQTIPVSQIVNVSLTVEDGLGVDRTNDFVLISNSNAGSIAPNYRVYIKQDLLPYFEAPPSTHEYNFTVTIETLAEIPTNPNHIVSFTETRTLENAIPDLRQRGATGWRDSTIPATSGYPSLPANTQAVVIGDASLIDPVNVNGLNSAVTNGVWGTVFATPQCGVPTPGWPVEATQEIKWEITKAYNVSTPLDDIKEKFSLYYGANGNLQAGINNQNYNENAIVVDDTLSNGRYVVQWQVTDANGTGLTYQYPQTDGLSELEFEVGAP